MAELNVELGHDEQRVLANLKTLRTKIAREEQVPPPFGIATTQTGTHKGESRDWQPVN